MQVVQQTQPVFSQIKRYIAPVLQVGASVLTLTIGIVASVIFQTAIPALAVASAVNIALALLTKDRWVIRIMATAFTVTIVSVALAVLFPEAIPFVLPLIGFTTSFSVSYSLFRIRSGS